MIEIGPGKGALTDEILKKPKSLKIIEKDNQLYKFLKKKNILKIKLLQSLIKIY